MSRRLTVRVNLYFPGPQSFDRDSKVQNKGNYLFEDITRSLANLVRKKQESVEHLYRETEKLVEASHYDNSAFDLVNAKRLDPRLGPYPHPDGCVDEHGNLRMDAEGRFKFSFEGCLYMIIRMRL